MGDAAATAIAAIVLAAGGSTRMGRPKALLPLADGSSFVDHVAATLVQAGVGRVIVVVRSEWRNRIRQLLARDEVDIVINPAPERGQLSSVQCGLSVVPATLRAVLIALVDVPLATAETVRTLIATQIQSDADVVRPERAGRHGHPILVTPAVAHALSIADDSETTRSVLRRYAARTLDVRVDDEGPFMDVDTPADYERISGVAMTARPVGRDEA
jgi:molybdenum cofactor cytidylyltransferase